MQFDDAHDSPLPDVRFAARPSQGRDWLYGRGIELAIAPPCLIKPRPINIGIRSAILLFEQSPQELFLIIGVKCPSFRFDFRDGACHKQRPQDKGQLPKYTAAAQLLPFVCCL
jgi:hypothetical protein